MQATVQWRGNVHFAGKSETGHEVLMDGPADHGGQNLGCRPMELVLLGLGGCTSFDVVSILKKARQDVTHCEAKLTAERAESVPSVFTKIHVHFDIVGNNLNPTQVSRAVSLSAEKYCSASLMLEAGGVEITHSFDIR